MYDYKLLEAMATVVNEGGFDKAAETLNITQSAVSQRIKLLEEQTGMILINRTTPPKPTSIGTVFLKHYFMVNTLEADLNKNISRENDQAGSIAIGINADSLATWFSNSIYKTLKNSNITIALYIDDQDETHKLLKDGTVAGCISSHEKTVQGCSSLFIGSMEYRMAATIEFSKKYFHNGFNKEAVKKAPAVIFNRKDDLHKKFLKQHFGDDVTDVPKHYVPSSESFADFIINGFGYGMIPLLQSKEHFEKGKLIELVPSKSIFVNLYWHTWNLNSLILNELSEVFKGVKLY
ncbi:MAG: LysR family transcriptional regulator ArgP [Desulfobacterales bacterium]|nr:LysR family transcriptional regulator ArgP [Desulfobacterales bacterium]MCP4161472.1 LysR family transcriptional regulator ArgP [Deltaproteobacteria bacterium]